MDNREGDREPGGPGGATPPGSGTAGAGGGHHYWYADHSTSDPYDDPDGMNGPSEPGGASPGMRTGRHASGGPSDSRPISPGDRPRHGAPPEPSETLSFEDLPSTVRPQTLPQWVTPGYDDAPPLPPRRRSRHEAPGPTPDDPRPLTRPTTAHLREPADPDRDQPGGRSAHTAEHRRVPARRPDARHADPDPDRSWPRGGAPDDRWPRGGTTDDSWPRGRSSDGWSSLRAADGTWPRGGAPDDSWPRGGAPDDSWPRGGAPDDSWPRGGAPDDSWPRGGTTENWPRRSFEIGPLAIDGGSGARALPPGPSGAVRLARRPRAALGPGRAVDFEGDDRDYPAVMWWTAIWYAVPALLYTLWTLTLSSTPPAGCTASSPDCSSLRSEALDAVRGHLFGVLVAAALSFGVAWCVRRITLSWRAISVGFAAAVIGAGFTTMVVTIIG